MSPTMDHTHGIHWYLDRLGCLKRANAPSDDAGVDATFGTNLHAWLDTYHTSGNGDVSALSAEATDTTVCTEQFLAEHYAVTFTPDSLGETLWAEGRLTGSVTINGRVYSLTGHPDRITRLSEADVAKMETERNIIIEPGIYLHDFKTKKKRSDMAIPQLLASAQPTAYHVLLAQNFPEWATEYKGCLFHILFRYKRAEPKSFQTIFVHPPDEDDIKRLQYIMSSAMSRVETLPAGHMTPTRCFDYNHLCPLFGECARYEENPT